jgi:hypothetical protein
MPPVAGGAGDAAPPTAQAPVEGASAAVEHPPPAAAPPVALSAVAGVLAKIPCAALAPAVDRQTLRVQGYLARSYGQTRLKDALAALPGVAKIELALHEVDDGKCPILDVLGRYWVARQAAGGGPLIRLHAGSGNGNQLKEGDTLMVDVTTPNVQSYVTVDYFVLDGNVVHLLPNALEKENLAPPHYTATVGSLGNWVIGRPFGNEILVLLSTPAPPFDSLRPPSEPGADYLHALDRQLARISKEHGAASVTVDFLPISTSAKR